MMPEEAVKFCRRILSDVSRSFALTIPMLDDRLYRPVMVTYLQDRLLDNFEDEGDNIPVERRKYLMDRVVEVFDPANEDPGEAINEIEENADLMPADELYRLTANTHLVREAYDGLDSRIKEFSHRWLVEMNEGMQEYLEKPVDTFSDLDEYCYYVAGTVGGFLTDLVVYLSDLSGASEKLLEENFVDAGLFLQKVNIIRDIKRDLRKREKNFWPLKELGISPEELLDENCKERAMAALDKMLRDVKRHIPGLQSYMETLPQEFCGYRRFFAVNNTLGLATLNKMENNPDVFYGRRKVKVSKLNFLRILKQPQKIFRARCEKYMEERS
ncbi:MAG: phytoene/squalene synthase family protein [Halanaerobiaceae bacterium]